MRVFRLIRHNDETGISGTGNIVDGIVFDDGIVVARWKTETASTSIYENWEAFEKVHILPHPKNKSEIQYIDVDWSKKISYRQMELK